MLQRRPEPPRPVRAKLARLVARPLDCVVGDHFAPGPVVALLILAAFAGLVVTIAITIAITLSILNAVLVVAAAIAMRLSCGRANRRAARP